MNPANAVLGQYVAGLKKQLLEPKVYLISKDSFERLISLFEKVPERKKVEDGIVRVTSETDYSADLARLADAGETFTATQILSTLLGAAQQYESSDIHVEPEEAFVKIRFRMDGVLQDKCHLPTALLKILTSRIKVTANLKLNVTDVPQDGRFTFEVGGKNVDVRVSVLPSPYGEGIVMRLLSNQAVTLKLDDLGFVGRSYDVIKDELHKPNGAILTTGSELAAARQPRCTPS